MKKWIVVVLLGVVLTGCGANAAPVVTPKVESVPMPSRVEFGNGRYLVANEDTATIIALRPGKYVTNGLGDAFNGDPNMGRCTWSLVRGGKHEGAGFVDGQTTVNVEAGQQFEVRGGCTWMSV